MSGRNLVLDQRLSLAYKVATEADYSRGATLERIEIHLGSNVIDYLRSMATHPNPITVEARLWGFPVVEAPAATPDHISVHTVQFIL